ncbi:MAG: glycerophosphodiester phosphodiesterase family protein [Winogradskyella sp.]|uniref:glycerophosphodiester phosphodiesterase family protein n=1 Tax=Winogradskyella sp. TaxID=1883156 RepID=UPI00183C6D87|nr:glycerophosphodiester phosphodiesterase family protein [Winogradskyella sp.]
MKRILLLILLIAFLGCKDSKSKGDVPGPKGSDLITLFKASNTNYPKISVHRGGKWLLFYPENALETIKYVSDSISAIYEIDIAQTRDGQLVLMHDNAVDRTTNGTGLVKDLTYNELRTLNLIDDYGNVTNFKIPLFSEVLRWCKANDIILTVDIKRSVSQKKVIRTILNANAEDNCILITYDVAQAQSAFKTAPELLLSVSARNHKEYDRLLQAQIPTENMIAFTGTRLSDISLYQRLHKDGIVCMLGTLGNLDRQAEARGDSLYKTWMSKGIDIIATDRPFKAFKAIN